MTVDHLKTEFAKIGLEPSRKLGQSFLTDDPLSSWIVDQLEIGDDDDVVEVGPGFGALTQFLAGQGKSLTLIEMDGRLAHRLGALYADDARIDVRHMDAVQADIRPWFRGGGCKLIGNLPYSAGSEILRTFLDVPTPVKRAVIMVQKEVGDRLCADPSIRAYGGMSIRLQARWNIRRLKTVGPEPFFPRPAVDSTILLFEPQAAGRFPPFSGEELDRLVARGFAQRRKQLRKNLGLEGDAWTGVCQAIGVPETVRAEQLSVEQWVILSDLVDDHPGKAGAQSAAEMFDVVDERDEVTGQAERGKVHAEGLLHRAVHMFVFNKAGELYLSLRSHLKDTHPGRWGSSAAGHLDAGESYADAALRELDEELKIAPKDALKRLLKLPAGPETDQEFVELFACRPSGKVRTHGSEIAGGRYFPLELIDQWMAARPDDFTPGFRSCFTAWRHG